VLTATGTLLVGDPASNTGVDFSGTLQVAGHAVSLLDAGTATLRGVASLGGGTMSTFAGLDLTSTAIMLGFGTVHGNVVNQGVVNGIVAPPPASSGITFTGIVSGAGSFPGITVFSGLYSPGNSPAIVSLGSPSFSGVLRMEIGGVLPGSRHDQLSISGVASLDGRLELVLINGYLPQAGDVFQLFDGTTTGRFAEISFPPLGSDLRWDPGTLYFDGKLRVFSTLIPEPAMGLMLVAPVAALRRPRRTSTRSAC
jgi:hypothetical protein